MMFFGRFRLCVIKAAFMQFFLYAFKILITMEIPDGIKHVIKNRRALRYDLEMVEVKRF